MSEQNFQEALRDLSTIRRIMRHVASTAGGLRLGVAAIDAAVTIHAIALVFAVAFLIHDLGLYPFSGPPLGVTALLTLSVDHLFLRVFLIGAAAILLFMLSVGLYIILWSAARKDSEEISDYVIRNFASFSALSFLSDLSIKFSAIAIAVAAKRPEWVSPLLLLFTADYLFQGRFFSLPFKLSLALGALTTIIGATQLFRGNPSLSAALSVFVAITIISMGYLIRRKKSVTQASTAGSENGE